MPVFLITLGFSFVVSVLLADYLPWWSYVPVSFLAGLWQGRKSVYVFIAGFLAVFFIWLGGASYFDTLSEGRMTTKVAHIFGLESKTPLLVITPILGGLLAGISAMTGFILKSIFLRKN